MAEHVEHVIGFVRKQSLHATVIRACRKCGAPGHWHDDPKLPAACYDPYKKHLAIARGEGFSSVGPVCPQCGSRRDEDERLGEIWSKIWRVPTLWEQMKTAIFNWRAL